MADPLTPEVEPMSEEEIKLRARHDAEATELRLRHRNMAIIEAKALGARQAAERAALAASEKAKP